MKRMILHMPDDQRKHIVYNRVHIINMAAKESNVFYIIRRNKRSEARKRE